MKKSDKGKEIFAEFDKKIKELEEKIESPETEQAIKDWLKFQSQFHNYSFHNTIWMMLQAAARKFDLEKVAPFKKWVELTGNEEQKVSINKGEKGFTILFPYEHIVYERDEKGRFITNNDGQKIPELDENGEVKRVRRFGVGYVFDVKQTNAREIGAFQDLDYRGKAVPIDADLVKEIAERITEKYGIKVAFVKDVYSAAGGWYDLTAKEISINLAVCSSNAHRLGTLFHELGHARMHHEHQSSRKVMEGQAEAFAYAASSAFGIERESRFYIKHWIKDDCSLKEIMGNISKQVKEAFNDLKLHELVKQQCREYAPIQEQEQNAEVA